MHIVADVARGVAWSLQSIHSQLPQLGEEDDDETIASSPGLPHFCSLGYVQYALQLPCITLNTTRRTQNRKQG